MIYDSQALKVKYANYSNINQKISLEEKRGNIIRIKRGLYTDNLLTEVLPGNPSNKNSSGTWVYIHDAKKTKALIQELFVNRDKTEEESDNTTGSNTTSTNSTSNTSTTVKKDNIKIEVLNGSGNSANLQTVVSKLEKAGYKVTKKGETNTTSKTTIINKKEIKDNYVTEIKNAVGMGITQNSQSTSSKVDLTIIIGKDYK